MTSLPVGVARRNSAWAFAASVVSKTVTHCVLVFREKAINLAFFFIGWREVYEYVGSYPPVVRVE